MIPYHPPVIVETPHDDMYLKAWLILEILGGQGGVPILLATLYFSSLRRTPTLYSLLWSLVVWSTVDLLLFYPSRVAPRDPEPPYGLCLTQSAFKLSVPILTACCSFSLLYDSWVVISGNSEGRNHPSTIRRITILVIFPWIVFSIATAAALGVGATWAGDLGRQRHFFFCTFKLRGLSTTTISITGVAILGTAYYTVRGIFLWYKSRQDSEDASHVTDGSRINPHMFLRVLVLGLAELMAVVLAILSVAGVGASRTIDLMIASVPLAILIIFATQMDVLHVYISAVQTVGEVIVGFFARRFSKKPKPHPEEMHVHAWHHSYDSRSSLWDGRTPHVADFGERPKVDSIELSPTSAAALPQAYFRPYDGRHVVYAQ